MRADADSLLVRSEHPQGAYAVRVLRTNARRYLAELGASGLSVLVVDDRTIRRLNREWRRKDRPTDVLSFEQDRRSGLLGDVVISLDTARRQAAEGSRALSDELTRLLAHGLLHLLGHDHLAPADARRMARAEVALLGSIGLVGEALAHPKDLDFKRVRNVRGRTNRPERRIGAHP